MSQTRWAQHVVFCFFWPPPSRPKRLAEAGFRGWDHVRCSFLGGRRFGRHSGVGPWPKQNRPFSSLQARGHFVLTPLDLDEIN